MEEKPLYGALTVYRERGAYLRRLEQYHKAKSSYDEAYKCDPQDLALLIGYSQACADAMEPQQAYTAAENALKINRYSMPAKNVQARALYTMTNFERSIVMNYQGSRIRRFPPYFIEGIIQGLETMQDCIGENAGQVMLDLKPIIMQQEAKNEMFDEDTVPRHISRIPQPENIKIISQAEKRKSDILARVLAMKYLGPMAYDKFFLQELTTDDRVTSANSAGSELLKNTIEETLKSLTECQDMLRAQRPYYTVKFAEKSQSKYLTKFKKNRLIKERNVSRKTADRYLREINESLCKYRLMDLISKAEKLQAFLDTRTPNTLPEINFYIDRLYRAIGTGYFNQHRLSYKLSEQSNRRRIAFLMGLPFGRPQSYDSVVMMYPKKYVDINVTIRKIEESLTLCENAYMRCWLYYEMARLLNTQKNYALAKFYAKRCQSEAQEIQCETWWMNGCYVLMAGEMQQLNLTDIRTAVEQAYEYSKEMPESDTVRSFLAKCVELAATCLPPDALKQRESSILKVMDEVSKVNTQILFKRMSTLPYGRRFVVMHRKADATVSYISERRKYQQTGLTVVPGKPRRLPKLPKSKVLGFQKFDI